MTWWQRLFARRRYTLLCMRLEEMLRVHPEQITGACSSCGEMVGIYPSGQRALAQYRGRIDIVCNHCSDPSAPSISAPGVLDDLGQSRWRPKR